ncbi:unnamed protein product [Closterium sp. NIES-53]
MGYSPAGAATALDAAATALAAAATALAAAATAPAAAAPAPSTAATALLLQLQPLLLLLQPLLLPLQPLLLPLQPLLVQLQPLLLPLQPLLLPQHALLLLPLLHAPLLLLSAAPYCSCCYLLQLSLLAATTYCCCSLLPLLLQFLLHLLLCTFSYVLLLLLLAAAVAPCCCCSLLPLLLATAAAGGGAATSAGSAAGAGGAGGATGSAGGVAGAGGAGPTTDRHCLPWPLSRQLQQLGVDSGGHCLSRTTPPLSSFASGFFSEPVQVVEALVFYVLRRGGSSVSKIPSPRSSRTSLHCPPVSSSPLRFFVRYLPTFSTNLVSNAAIQDVWVDTFIPGGQRVAICTCSRPGRHLAAFTRRSGSSLHTLTTASAQVAAAGQVVASSQVSASGQLAASCSCRDVTFDESICYYRLHPHASHPVPLMPLFLVPVSPSVDPLPPQGPAPSGVSQVDLPPLVEPFKVCSDSSGPAEGGDHAADDTAATRRSPCLETPPSFLTRPSSPPPQPAAVDYGAETAGAESGGAEQEGDCYGGAATGGATTGGAGSWSAVTRGADSGGPASPSGGGAVGDPAGGPGAGQPPQPDLLETLLPQAICAWIVRRGSPGGGGYGPGGAGAASPRGTVGAKGTGGAAGARGAGAFSPRGATGAAGAGPTSPRGAAGDGGAGATSPIGATGPAGAGPTSAGAGGTGGASAAGPGGARSGGAGAAGAGGAVRAGGATGAAGSGGTGGAAGAGAVGAGGTAGAGASAAAGAGGAGGAAGAAGAGGAGTAGAGGAGVASTALRRPLPSSTGLTPPVLCPPTAQTQQQLLPRSPIPALGPHTEVSESLTERREPETRASTPVCACRVARPRPPADPGTHGMALCPSSVPQRVVLPEPPASSLLHVSDPESDLARAASPTDTCLLATVVTDPDLESTTVFALVTELVDFAARSRLDYVASLVTESEFVCPPFVGGELALGSDVLEDRKFEIECLAATLPHFASMLLCPEGDPDALDIPTPRSHAEAITGEYSSQVETAMDAEMASWKSRGTYVDEVPPPRANIVDGMWIFRVKRPPDSPPAFKARYIARGFSQRQGVDFFQTFSPTPKMTTLRVLLHVATKRNYELHSLDFSTTFPQGSLHEEIWLRRPPGFTGSFPAGTRWTSGGQSTVLEHFTFQFSSPQPTPLSTGHSLLAPPSDESVEPSGPYPELVGCLITSGMGLVLGGQGSVVLTGHSDTSWADNQATQRSSQGYTFSLGSVSVSWRSTHSSSVLGSSCEAKIYAGAMAAQELRWLTYLLTDLVERPRSPPILMKHIALRYFLARELQQRRQLRLSYVASRANTADVFTKALGCGDHHRFCTTLGLVPTLPHLLVS